MPLSKRQWIVIAILLTVTLGTVAALWALVNQPTGLAASPSLPAPTPAEPEVSIPEPPPAEGNPFASLLGATPAPPVPWPKILICSRKVIHAVVLM